MLKSRDITDKAPVVGVMVFMVFPVVMYGCGSWAIKKAEDKMFSNCGAREDSYESLRLQGDQTSQFQKKSTLNIHWKD